MNSIFFFSANHITKDSIVFWLNQFINTDRLLKYLIVDQILNPTRFNFDQIFLDLEKYLEENSSYYLNICKSYDTHPHHGYYLESKLIFESHRDDWKMTLSKEKSFGFINIEDDIVIKTYKEETKPFDNIIQVINEYYYAEFKIPDYGNLQYRTEVSKFDDQEYLQGPLRPDEIANEIIPIKSILNEKIAIDEREELKPKTNMTYKEITLEELLGTNLPAQKNSRYEVDDEIDILFKKLYSREDANTIIEIYNEILATNIPKFDKKDISHGEIRQHTSKYIESVEKSMDGYWKEYIRNSLCKYGYDFMDDMDFENTYEEYFDLPYFDHLIEAHKRFNGNEELLF